MRAKNSKIKVVNLEKVVQDLTNDIVVSNGNIVLIKVKSSMYICKVVVEEGVETEGAIIDIYNLIVLDQDRVCFKIPIHRGKENVLVRGKYLSPKNTVIKIEGICDISIGIDKITR